MQITKTVPPVTALEYLTDQPFGLVSRLAGALAPEIGWLSLISAVVVPPDAPPPTAFMVDEVEFSQLTEPSVPSKGDV